METNDTIRALTIALAFAALLAAHYFGDHWLQTGGQALKKALGQPNGRTADAVWHCAKHVATYCALGLGLFLLVAAQVNLPLRPGWIAAGMVLHAGTHFLADLRTPLRWAAGKVGLTEYIEHCNVARGAGVHEVGPGTALFHLDQSWHILCIFFVSCLFAGF